MEVAHRYVSLFKIIVSFIMYVTTFALNICSFMLRIQLNK